MRCSGPGVGRGALALALVACLAAGGCARAGRAVSPLVAAAPPRIEHFDVDKVTYLSLSPEVECRLTLGGAPPPGLAAEFRIHDLARGVVLASAAVPLDGVSTRTVAASLPVRVSQMTGLLAEARLIEPRGGVAVDAAECPFDVTDDLRTNFRYAGETYGGVSRALEPRPIGEGTPDDFWKGIPVGTPPQVQLDRLRACFQNVAEVSVEEGRGHYTCWEEGSRQFWNKSAYHTMDIWEFSHERILHLYREGDRRGIYMLPWTDGKGARKEYFDEGFPWIDPWNPNGYYPGNWLMNLDPKFHRPLTPEELKLAHIDLHGTESWIDFVVEELVRMTDHYRPRIIWWDNSYGGEHIEYTLSKLRARWANEQPERTPPLLMINGNAGYHSDIYWIEHDLPARMDGYLWLMRQLIKDRPAVAEGSATIFSGQHHPAAASGQQAGISDPKNIYNDAATTFMFRQLLFECLASDPRIVGQQQWPRNALEWRIGQFPEAFADHARTWGFQTLFAHVYNARDVRPYALAASVEALGAPATREDAVEDGKLHLVARAPLSDPDRIYLHVFNYLGTTIDVLARRPRPARADVTLRLDVPGFAGEYRVRAFSPDFARYGDCVAPATVAEANHLQFDVPVETYTLVIIDRPRAGWR
ncbi:MAG TPA: hypothetical protein PLS90_10135 [Candidatus Sumerlaeota bacterium]|nr:MAG: hypothetical protein BWZ08_01108 [candidate division BRC1 bacterium ADurb.BinA292]HOE96580.1 hypothetical protein [Candidatus Sumerlaeota bacterium]HOR27629.1 hypothetical protein [Candidatus Sumerlaeota bacterium]HPK02800.1 hypothetical protein [Candidatus Sumerlaeota bacterium]